MFYRFFFNGGNPKVEIEAQSEEALRAAVGITAIIAATTVAVVALKS